MKDTKKTGGLAGVVAGRSDFDPETMLHLQQIDFYMYQSDNNC